MQAATKKEVEAHQTTRALLHSTLTNLASCRQQAALNEMDAALQQTLAAIQTAEASLLARLSATRRDKAVELEQAIVQAVQPLQDKADELEKKAERAFAEFKAAPNELVFRDRHIATDKDYLTVQATVVDIHLDALKSGLKELDAAEAAARERLAAAAVAQAQAASEQYLRAVQKLSGQAASPPNLGPEPVVPVAAFDGLTAYAGAVEQAADGNLNYLRSNSFGTGSFFRDFLSSVGRGFVPALFDPSARSLDTAGVLNAGAAVGGELMGNLREHLNDAVAGFKLEGNSILADVATTMAEQARKAVESFVSGKLNRLKDKLGAPAATSNP